MHSWYPCLYMLRKNRSYKGQEHERYIESEMEEAKENVEGVTGFPLFILLAALNNISFPCLNHVWIHRSMTLFLSPIIFLKCIIYNWKISLLFPVILILARIGLIFFIVAYTSPTFIFWIAADDSIFCLFISILLSIFWTYTESEDEVGRDIWRSTCQTLLLKEAWIESIVQEYFEYLQRGVLHKFF